jgi:hypothetical protein
MKHLYKTRLKGSSSGKSFVFPQWLLFFLLVFTIGISPQSNGQTPKTATFAPLGYMTYIRHIDTYTNNSTDNLVGNQLLSVSDYRFLRKAMNYSVGTIPANATITGCSLSFNSGAECGNFDGTLVFTKIRYDFLTIYDAKTVYDLILAGTEIVRLPISSTTTYTAQFNPLIQEIQNTVMAGNPYYLGLGVYNQDEFSWGGTSFSSPSLKINYTIPTPPPPASLTVSAVTSVGCTLSWTASPGNVTGYKVYVNGALMYTTSSTSQLITGYCPSTLLNMYVVAYNPYGNSDPTGTVKCTTLTSTLSGPTLICSTATYTLTNLPASGSVIWSTTPNITMVSPQGSNPCVFQKYSNGNGSITATLACNIVRSIQVHTGPYSSSDYQITGPSSASCRQYVNYTITPLPDATTINWVWPSGWTYSSGQNSNYLSLRTGTTGGAVMVGVNNACGQSGSYASKYTSVSGSCGYSLVVSPNPATNVISVTIPDETVASSDVLSSEMDIPTTIITTIDKPVAYQITVMDNMGVAYLKTTKYSKSFTLPVQNLRNGNYQIIITDGINKFTSQLVVSH